MGTDKRERQKANRAAKQQAQAAQARATSRRRTIIGFIVVVAAVAAIVGLIYLGGGDSGSSAAQTDEETTAPSTADLKLEKVEFTYGTTPCPPASGATERKLKFDAPPKNCLEEGKQYSATFDTTAGTIDVDLDTAQTPGTVNNFVFLARNRYYDDTKFHRVNTLIDIVQGGAPHSESTRDAGPGYRLQDEGMFSAGSVRGGYTYEPGDLAMGRSSGPNSAGSQYFFVTGDGAASLDSQGTYVVFGHVTSGLDILQKIVATADVDASGEGRPSPEVTVTKVTITQK